MLIVYTLIQRENGEKAFQEKIEKCVEKIKRNENEYRIDYLTIMLVGKSGVGKSTRASIWMDEFKDSFIVNGDKPLIKISILI